MTRPQIKRARDKAREIVARFDVQNPPIPVERIAKQLGLRVTYSPLDPELSGIIYARDGSTIVGVNSLHHPNRQRFTLAHECGHHLLHSEKLAGLVHVDKQFSGLMRSELSSQGVDPIEVEANQFAAELLVPEQFLVRQLANRPFDVQDDELVSNLAKRFQVSTQTMTHCLSNLLKH